MKKSLSFFIYFMTLVLSPNTEAQERGTVTDIDGNIYRTITIGNYLWMAENLKTSTLNNGIKIPCIGGNSDWIGLDSFAYCWYDNDESNAGTLGALYNWYAINTGNLCPSGWRVPDDEEWKYLEGYVDTHYRAGDTIWDKPGLRGFDASMRLKALNGWQFGNNGLDIFGFSALPCGERSSIDGRFHLMGYNGYWWSSTGETETDAWYRSLIYSMDEVSRDTHGKKCGFSVRCIRNK